MTGWIKLHRSITKHWIFKDAEKLKAWITILSEVNHAENKINLGDSLFIVKRGESIKSLDTWAKLFGNGWNKSKVRRFFKLLESDSMIVTKSERKTTRLTVCNYDIYQDERNDNETIMKRKRNNDETIVTPNKNVKNDKKEKKEDIYTFNFKKSLIEIGVDKDNVDEWLKHRNKAKASNTQKAFNMLVKQFELSNRTPNECVEICLGYKERTGAVWTGFKAEWLEGVSGKCSKKLIDKVRFATEEEARRYYGDNYTYDQKIASGCTTFIYAKNEIYQLLDKDRNPSNEGDYIRKGMQLYKVTV